MSLAETIYANLVAEIYADLSKAKAEDLRKLAEHAIRAAQVFADTAPSRP